ncbi:phage integrase family protein [Listeria floridensis FSL S10-1187]|uniref:Phage integrase family protein n=1 Tax=Listeria floridensis FSL S10-1187 TaxID=1265817 RepID=A0ABN0RHN8_9LIST|nr:phage integrase family protein [Listeria floridensis FSL S10-1187]
MNDQNLALFFAYNIQIIRSKMLYFQLFKQKMTPHYLTEKLENLIYGERQLSNCSVSLIKSKLNAVFQFAKRRGYIIDTSIEKVEIRYSRNQDSKTKTKFLEDNEYTKLIEYTKQINIRYALLFGFIYCTGLRAGEAISLTENDVLVDENGVYVLVSGTLEYKGKKVTEQIKSSSTKTSAGMREVDLPQNAIKLLEKMAHLNAETSPEYIFSTNKGTPIQITAINTFLRKAKEALKIDKQVSSHIFRHTHVSKLAELGTPLFAIQDRVGHENSKITELIYLHVTKGVREKMRRDIERL